ncbi:hypothetical protein TNCV_1041401 [Trichonephila clavipes]|nr:hypothetical protein TNCV_1041401 [Trichonephila clavipes]
MELVEKFFATLLVEKLHKGCILVRDSFVQKSETSGHLTNDLFILLPDLTVHIEDNDSITPGEWLYNRNETINQWTT